MSDLASLRQRVEELEGALREYFDWGIDDPQGWHKLRDVFERRPALDIQEEK